MTVQSELSIGFSEAAARKAKLLIDEEANEALSLTNTARVSGNLYYQSLQMAAGSCLSGSLRQMEASEIKALMVSEENINRRTAIGRLQAVSEQELKRLSENNSASST